MQCIYFIFIIISSSHLFFLSTINRGIVKGTKSNPRIRITAVEWSTFTSSGPPPGRRAVANHPRRFRFRFDRGTRARRVLARGSEHYLSGPLYTVRSRSEGPNRRRFVEVGATPASLGLYSLVVAISPVKRDLFSFICALARSPSSSSQRSAGSRRAIWRVFAALIREGFCLDHRRLLDLRRAGFGCSFSHI